MITKVFRKSKQAVTACDLFSTTELLRYKENPEFKSASGGLCSLAIIVGFTIIFTQTILNTFQRTSITSQTTLFEETDPTYFSTRDTPFLFALGITGFNINSPTVKYFNIEISQKSVINGVKATQVYTLVPCNRTAWLSVDSTLGPQFDTIGLGNWLCLPTNITFQFAGKYTSKMFQYMKISVKDCKILAGDTRSCANSSIIDSYIAANGPISFNYYFVNTIINADNTEYLGSYLEDRNYFQFTRTLGTSANIFISTYAIDTDENLWPWTNIVEDAGGIVYESTQRYVYTPTILPNATEYVSLYLRKSSLSLAIQRSFKKYDDTLSYIGGLFSSFMACLFFILKYSEYCYEIDIASKIYRESKKAPIQSSKFNIVTLVGYCIYCILDFVHLTPDWKLMKHFDDVRQEMGKQLDLKLLLRKISFLEDCINYVFEDYQLECLHLKGKMTLSEAEAIRKRFSSRRQLLKLKKKFQAKGSQEQKCNENKQSINLSNHQVFDFTQFNKEGEKEPDQLTIIKSKTQILQENSRQQEMESDCSDIQDEQESSRKLLLDYISSITQLKQEAENGNRRCMKIYNNLDRTIKSIPSTIKGEEQDGSLPFIFETISKISPQKGFSQVEEHLVQNIQYST